MLPLGVRVFDSIELGFSNFRFNQSTNKTGSNRNRFMFLVLKLVDFSLKFLLGFHGFHNDGIRVLPVLGSQIVFIP